MIFNFSLIFCRGYYKCSTVRGCPARKHVERAQDDPKMLIVTYEGEHRHVLPLTPVAGVGFSIQSSWVNWRRRLETWRGTLSSARAVTVTAGARFEGMKMKEIEEVNFCVVDFDGVV